MDPPSTVSVGHERVSEMAESISSTHSLITLPVEKCYNTIFERTLSIMLSHQRKSIAGLVIVSTTQPHVVLCPR